MKALQTRHLRPEDLRGKRARFYLRESSQAQADRGTPLSAQRDQCERAVSELGLVLSEPHEYVRVGTGEEFSPELAQATEDGRVGAFDVLVVAFSSRLGRNVLEVGLAKRALATAGVIVYVVESHSISGARTTRLAENVKAAVDEEENAERAARIAGGLRERQLSGKWVGMIPYGFRKCMSDNADGSRSWDGTLEPDPEQADIVKRIFGECLVGRSPLEIAEGLTREGIRNSNGGVWHKGSVRTMLANPIYAGRMERYRRNSSPHYFPDQDPRDGHQILGVPWAIIGPEVFDAAQMRFPRARGTMRNPRGYPLTGVLRCGLCGAKMQGAYNGKGDRYYRCGTRASAGTCQANYVRAEGIETAFADWLGTLRLPADWREEIARQKKQPRRSEDKQAKLRGHLERVRTLYTAGDIPWEQYVVERDQTREALAEQVPADPDSLEKIAAILSEVGPLWRNDRIPSLPPLIVERLIVNGRKLAEIEVRASLRPLLEVCVAEPTGLDLSARHYTPHVRYV